MWTLDRIRDYDPLFDVSFDFGFIIIISGKKELLKTLLVVRSETPAVVNQAAV